MAFDPALAKSLFLAAADLPDAERAAYLDRECGGDADLRARVEALLRADDAPMSSEPGADATGALGAGEPATGTFAPGAAATAVPTSDYPGRDETAGSVVGGKYTLVESIGEGGMGSVWRARQTEPVKRFVAVKLIKAGMDSRQVLARFEAERQALALMDHVNIAKVFDGGLHEGRPFFVMELVKGVPITEYCDHCKLTPRQRLELFVQVCQAIQHAHQKGVIHRDIKPSNVLIALYDDKPVVKVIDFGVAKATGAALTERTIDTGFGGVVGTPQYMSPEQATFNNLDIDTRSDIYSLGVLLYELLAGSPPFSKKDLDKKGLLEILRVVREEEPPRPSTKLFTADALPTLSANRGTEPRKLTGLLRNELDWIVMKALEKDRARRYETANGFAADVQRYLAGDAVLAHPPGAAYRLRKFVRRNRGRVLAASLVLLTLLVGVAGTTAGLIRAEGQRLLAERKQREADDAADAEAEQRLKAESAQADADRQRIQAQELLSHTGAERGRRLLEGGNSLGLLDLLEARRAAEGRPLLREARTILWSGWEASCSGRLEQVLPNKSPVTAMAFAPDGKTMATLDTDGVIVAWDVATGRAQTTIQTPRDWIAAAPLGALPNEQTLTYAPDGAALMLRWGHVSGKGGVQAWDLATGRPRSAPVDLGLAEEKVCLSPDGRVLVGSRGATLQKRDALTGKPVGPAWKAAGPVGALLFSPDGKLVVTLGAKLEWWDAATGQPHAPSTPAPQGPAFDRSGLEFSPNGKWLICRYTSPLTQAIHIHDAVTGKLVGTPVTTDDPYADVKISADGKTLILLEREPSVLREGRILLWDTATGKIRGALVGHEGEAVCVALSADGRHLATGGLDGTARLWDVGSARPLGPALWHANMTAAVAFAPDGAVLATRDEGGVVRLWRTETRPAHGPAYLKEPAQAFAFGPDGKWLVVADEQGMRRWDLATLQPLGKVWKQASPDPCLAVGPDGAYVAAAVEMGIQLWDAATGRPHGPLLEFAPGAAKLAFGSDGKRLVAMSPDGRVRMWNPVNGKPCDPPFRGGEKEAAYFDLQISDDGKLVATRSSFGLDLWRTDTGQELPFDGRRLTLAMSPGGLVLAAAVEEGEKLSVRDPLTGRTVSRFPTARFSPTTHPEFSPDGKLVALPNEDQTVELWDVTTAKQHGPRLVNRLKIQRVVFAPNGKMLATLSPGGTIRCWDVATGQQLGPPWEPTVNFAEVLKPEQIKLDTPTQLAFSPDSRLLATLGADGVVKIWPVPNARYSLREMELRTWLSLGIRTDERGSWQSIPGQEWQALREELRTLQAKR